MAGFSIMTNSEDHEQLLADASAPTPGMAEGPQAPERILQDTPTVSETEAAGIAASVVARKRGRHPNTCNCERCQARRASGVKQTLATTKPVVDAAVLAKQHELAKQTIIACTHGLDTISVIVLKNAARKVKASNDFLRKLETDVPMTPQIRSGVAETGAIVSAKYGVDVVLPELALAGFLVTYAAAIAKLYTDIQAMGKETPNAKAGS